MKAESQQDTVAHLKAKDSVDLNSNGSSRWRKEEVLRRIDWTC